MTLDAILIGDSHTLAMKKGAERIGLNVGAIQFSGAVWHQGKFAWSSEAGYIPKGIRSGKSKVNRLREQLDNAENVFSMGIPVVASVGFHLGLLAGAMNWYNHKTLPAYRTSNPSENSLVSSQFVDQYIAHFRTRHIRFLKRMSNSCPVVIVAPPNIPDEPNLQYFRANIIAMMLRSGLNVFDPVEHLFGPKMMFPKNLIAEDGKHGSVEYGQKVVSELIKIGFLNAVEQS